jgi:undecaprenyl-diphosphatase
MNSNSPGNIFDVFFSDDLGFPSGHALIAVVLYTALAKYSGRRLIYTSARYVVYVFAALLIFLIGVSRLFTSHTPTEVIAGWSAGLFWLSITNYFFVKH